MPYKANETRRHKIPRARYRVANWSAYDAILRRRGNLAVWVTPEAIAVWTPTKTGRRGRPARYSDIAIEAGLMLRLAFGRPWRQTAGFLVSLMRLLGLELPVPDHSTFSRCSADLEVASALARTEGPVTVVIDTTGLKVFGKGEWHLEQRGGTARRTWRKLHLAVDPGTGEILASALASNEEGDALLVGPLLDQSPRPIGTVLADGADDGEPVYHCVTAHSPTAEMIIPPRSNAVPSDTIASARTPRDRHIQLINERGRLGWQQAVQYGRRSLGEVAMTRYKQVIGHSLHARTLPAQKVEAAVGCKVMNFMTSLGMPATRKVT
ncbi:IS5 family transposase [Azospirillum sp. SYSU D00513]|uniref:IS5 family transposase n=1 Tax=Azospirillum sp. SYSU D00513 TaxID=2812561 RepID=UPI001A97B19A|nr:IS5 family transposase [Azospirillum sp. SYSU D00513]